MIGLAALLALAAPASATAAFAGTYQTHQMEMAGALDLAADGHFRYAFDYGAVSETAAGEWTADAGGVTLTSNPMPTAPKFDLIRDDPAPRGELSMTLEDPGVEWGSPLKALARSSANSREGFEIAADDRGKVDLSGLPAIAEIAPVMPVFGPTGDIFALSPERGHRLRFRFHANDLGKVAFHRQRLPFAGGALVLERFETPVRFVRNRP